MNCPMVSELPHWHIHEKAASCRSYDMRQRPRDNAAWHGSAHRCSSNYSWGIKNSRCTASHWVPTEEVRCTEKSDSPASLQNYDSLCPASSTTLPAEHYRTCIDSGDSTVRPGSTISHQQGGTRRRLRIQMRQSTLHNVPVDFRVTTS
jgi:hypothetical protein